MSTKKKKAAAEAAKAAAAAKANAAAKVAATPVAPAAAKPKLSIEEKFANKVNRQISARAKSAGARGTVMSRVSRGMRGLERRRYI